MGWKEHRLKEYENNHVTVKNMLMKAGLEGLRIKEMNCGLTRPTLTSHLKKLKKFKKVRKEGKRWFWIFPEDRLKTQLNLLKNNDLFIRGLFQDKRFDELILQKLSEGFKVREDIFENGKIIDVKEHSFGFEDLINEDS